MSDAAETTSVVILVGQQFLSLEAAAQAGEQHGALRGGLGELVGDRVGGLVERC